MSTTTTAAAVIFSFYATFNAPRFTAGESIDDHGPVLHVLGHNLKGEVVKLSVNIDVDALYSGSTVEQVLNDHFCERAAELKLGPVTLRKFALAAYEGLAAGEWASKPVYVTWASLTAMLGGDATAICDDVWADA